VTVKTTTSHDCDEHRLGKVAFHVAPTTEQLTREITTLKEIIDTRLDGMDRAIVLFQENLTRVPTETDKSTGNLKEFLLQKFATVFTALDGIAVQFKERDTRVAQRFDSTQHELATALVASKELTGSQHTAFAQTMNEKFLSVATQFTEKFDGIAVQFKERDTRVEQTAKASKEALDAALQAAKEAVGKQNDSFAQAILKVEASFTKQIDQIGLMLTTTVTAINDKIDDLKSRLNMIEGMDRGKTTQVTTHQASGTYAMGMVGLVSGIVIGALTVVATFALRGH
jgi:hypothetical protein